MKGTPRQNSARLFLEFLSSRNGQEAYRAAGDLAADPAIAPEPPGISPETGDFKAAFVPLSTFDANARTWIGVYNELFI